MGKKGGERGGQNACCDFVDEEREETHVGVDEEVAREHAQASPRPDAHLCETKRVSIRQHTSAYVSIRQVRMRTCVKPRVKSALAR